MTASRPALPTIVFTAFEPSGDAHAAPVIAALKRARADLPVYAWGGPKMAAAGADLLETTAVDGSMGFGAIGRIRAMRETMRRMNAWLDDHRVTVHVPVDSPAANFPIAKIMRHRRAKIVHLVCPQVWAWGPWRVGKLRRNTNLVLCLLPFEQSWLTQRHIPARFIGHPVINRALDREALGEAAQSLPEGAPKIAVLPGSRTQEVRANLPLMADVFRAITQSHADAHGVLVAARQELVETIETALPDRPANLHLTVDMHDAALHWCDVALTVSGTASLDIARHRKPMVGVYVVRPLSKLLSRVVLTQPHRLLPNIIAGRRIVPEFVPHAGGPEPIIDALRELIDDPDKADAQRAALKEVCAQYNRRQPAREAAEAILAVAAGRDLPAAPEV